MRRYVYIGLILLFFSGCQNNGYIGDLFGKWQLRTIEREGVEERCDTVFFSFQSDVFNSAILPAPNSYRWVFGKYTMQSNQLKVEVFTENDSINSDDYQVYGEITKQMVNGKELFSAKESFEVLVISKKELVLKSTFDERVMRFRKH